MGSKSSILRKMILLVLGTVIVSVAGTSYFTLTEFLKDKEKYVQEVTQHHIETFGRRLGSDIQSIVSGLSTLRALTASSLNSENPSQVNQQNQLLLKAYPVLYAFGIVRTDEERGKEPHDSFKYLVRNQNKLLSAVPNDLDLQRLADFAVNTFKIKRNKGRIFQVSQPYSTLLIVEALDKENKFISVGFISTDLFKMDVSESKLQTLRLVNETSVYDFLKGRPQTPPEIDQDAAEMMRQAQTETGSKRMQDSKNQEWFVSYFKINDQIGLISRVDVSKAFAARDDLIRRGLHFSIFMASLSLVIGVIFARSIVRPLRMLTSATEDMAAGRYTLSIDTSSNDEIADLARSFALMGRRLSQREQELEKVTELAIKDGMTGLYNHRFFLQRLTEVYQLAKRNDRDFAVILLDVDFFKKFNDTYGHQQGDEVLRSLGKLLKEFVRGTDIPCRYGGEEFVVILPDTDLTGAVQVAENIRDAFQKMDVYNIREPDKPLHCTCSLGVASWKTSRIKEPAELVEVADLKLYEAKKAGRNRAVA